MDARGVASGDLPSLVVATTAWTAPADGPAGSPAGRQPGSPAGGPAGSGAAGADRWEQALHNLYLGTLGIALAMTATSVVVPAPLPTTAVWLVICLAAGALTAGDLLVRRLPAGRGGPLTAYLLGAGATLGLLTAVLPTFAVVAFGALPLAFVLLGRAAATAVAALLTGLPYPVRPHALGWLFGPDAPPGLLVRFGSTYQLTVGVALPVLIGVLTASAIRAVSAARAELAAASRQAGQAEERQRLAHELHDTLAQGLSGVVLQLAAAEQELDRHPPSDGTGRLARLVTGAERTARDCLADTRRAVEALRPELLDRTTLVDAVAEVCRRWTEQSGLPARPAVRGQPERCPPQIEVVALRVVQEALANAGKHAAARAVSVTVEYRPGELRIAVRDDGRGIDSAPAPAPDGHRPGGHGLATMRERVTAVGGTLTITGATRTGPGSTATRTGGPGTTVTATLPIPATAPAAAAGRAAVTGRAVTADRGRP
jgi:signal transduction histidine kinase